MTRFQLHALFASLAFSTLAAPARADDTLLESAPLKLALTAAEGDPQPLRLFPQLEFTFTAGVWLPRLSGSIALGPAPGADGEHIDVKDQFDLRELEPTFLGELEIRKAEIFSVLFSGFDFSTSGSGLFPDTATFGSIALTPGTPYTGEFEMTSFSAELSIGFFRPFKGLANTPVDLKVSPLFVARWVDADVSITSAATTASAGSEWLGAMAGLRVEVDLYPDSDIFLISGLKLDASFALGPALGGDNGFMWQVRAGLTASFTPNIAFTFGYRLLTIDVDDGPLTFDNTLAGLFIGGSLRF
jgi:hypothetical protein